MSTKKYTKSYLCEEIRGNLVSPIVALNLLSKKLKCTGPTNELVEAALESLWNIKEIINQYEEEK